jgi:hypothetical protein
MICIRNIAFDSQFDVFDPVSGRPYIVSLYEHQEFF